MGVGRDRDALNDGREKRSIYVSTQNQLKIVKTLTNVKNLQFVRG